MGGRGGGVGWGRVNGVLILYSVFHMHFLNLNLPKHRCSRPYYNSTNFTEAPTQECQRGDLSIPLYDPQGRAPT